MISKDSEKIEFNLEEHISETLLNHLYEGVYFVDNNRKILFWNKGAENITGYKANEIVGKYCDDNILQHKNSCGESLCKTLCPLLQSIQKDEHKESRLYLKHKKGYRVPVMIHINPVKDKSGMIIGAVEIFHDDSAFEELKNANKKLEDLNKLKNQFIGMVAHDLRNPLTVIMSFSSLLLTFKKKDLSKEDTSIIQKINNASNKMMLLISDLLDLSSIEAGKINIKKKLQPIDLLLNMEELAMKLIAEKKDIKIVTEIEKNLPTVNIDYDRMIQVLENLVGNAVKFSYSKTTITIKAYKEDQFLCISVKDQGQGIPEEELSKLFKPFQKTSVLPTGQETSTGLGLILVKKIIEAHSGKMMVNSVVNEGSEFIIKLPLET